MNQYHSHIFIFFVFVTSFILPSSTFAQEFLSPEDLERWFNSDDIHPTRKVNDGQLTFLNTKVKKGTFRSDINITIDQNSIDNGWIILSQCYSNLDSIHRTAIVYRKNFIKNLTVLSSKNIKLAEVSGNKVLLQDVKKDASLCVTLNSRTFYQNDDLSFSLVIGPYHRKFLDGYFPYHLNLYIHYNPKLKFKYSVPKSQPGFEIKRQSSSLLIDTLFEGRLKTEFRFIHKQ